MSAPKSVLRINAPKEEWTPSPKLKRKTNSQNTPLSHRNHKRIGSSSYWKSCAKERLRATECSYNSIDKKIKPYLNNSFSRDVPSPLAIHFSPCNKETNEERCLQANSPTLLQLPQYVNIPSLNLTKLPLSPSMFECPTNDSPNYQHVTPFNEFLYTPDRCGFRLGRGSYGNVSLYKYGKRLVALKMVHCPETSPFGEKHLLGVRHAHLVSILKVFQLADTTYILMDFAGHSNLQQLLDNKADLPFKWRLRFAQQIASGLNHCHRLNIAHGDVKPVNVIVDPKGTCKLGDFGLSVRIGVKADNSHYRDDGFTGTAAYAAPEVLRGRPLSLEADIYSFGITLWQLYTNEIPFAGEHPHVVIYKVVSSNFRPVFEKPTSDPIQEKYINLSIKCWDKNPEERPFSKDVSTNLNKLCLAIFKLNATNRVA